MTRWGGCIGMSCALVLSVLTGCVTKISPDLRQVQTAYTGAGAKIPESEAVTISRVYLDQLLKDWDACHPVK